MSLSYLPPEGLDLSLGHLRQLRRDAVEVMKRSLATKGQLCPLVASVVNGCFVLVDGFCRRLAALELDIKELAVEVCDLSSTQMLAQLHLRNRERGLTLVEQCRLVAELSELEGLSQVEIADLLECHKSWVCRRLALTRTVSPQLLGDVALGLLTPGSLRNLAELPMRNQEELVAVARRDGLKPQQLATLARLWRKAPTQEARQYLLESPRGALEALQRPEKEGFDVRLGTVGQQILEGLKILRVTSVRLFRVAAGSAAETWPEQPHQLLRGASEMARLECNQALGVVERLLAKSPAAPDASQSTQG